MISTLMLRVATLLLLCGMVFGIVMGIRNDFSLAPAHAHWNLVGFVLMFLVGLYYRVVPLAEKSPLAKIQAGLHITGAIVFPIGIAIADTGGTQAPVIIGSLVVLAATALFSWIVFQTSGA
ncbi:MAG TPA: hypothetical protein VKW08_22605 [Xanthobacteraceae bacterium]|jgi:peptidoglycan/LPS O-acetylase OafA/YrhL|nr:hypothetical protein [Xanthobacteraceae bacterium]